MATTRKAQQNTNDTRTLLVERHGDKFKITIPADWKVTFGKSMQGRDYDNDRELRIYEAETKQRACFTGVKSFRDLSLPITRLVTTKSGEHSWVEDTEGGFTETRSVKKSVVEVDE